MPKSQEFWDFSVRTYYRAGVQEAFLALQNERGVDINMLLFCIWLGRTHGVFSDSLFSSTCDFSARWAQHVVAPLRAVRTWMKGTGCHDGKVAAQDCMDLREKVKGVEFAAEKLQEEVLESLCADRPRVQQCAAEQLAASASNVRRYLARLGMVAEGRVLEQLNLIMAAAAQGEDRQGEDRPLSPC